MTREEWLQRCARHIRRSSAWPVTWGYGDDSVLPSFPRRNARTVMLGDIAMDADGTTVLLVSPLISESLEVALVTYWLQVRKRYGFTTRQSLKTRRAEDAMFRAGFVAPFDKCIPSERTIEAMATTVTDLVDAYGEYPSAPVNEAPAPTQTTRLLKVVCPARHIDGPYILRMSRSQVDRGAPYCGVCTTRMIVEG